MGPEGWTQVETTFEDRGVIARITSPYGRHATRQRFVSITAARGVDVLSHLTHAGIAYNQHDDIGRPVPAPQTDPSKPLLRWRSITGLDQEIDYFFEDLHAETAS